MRMSALASKFTLGVCVSYDWLVTYSPAFTLCALKAPDLSE